MPAPFETLPVNVKDKAVVVFLLMIFSGCAGGLECYHCGTDGLQQLRPLLPGASMAGLNGHNNDSKEVVPNCNHFNASRPEFRVQCQPHEKGCLKGWISQAPYPKINNGIVRSCTPIQDNVCLYQQGGGACSCGHDLCNGGMGHPKMTLLPLILLPQLSSYLLKTMLILVESEKQHYFRSRTTT